MVEATLDVYRKVMSSLLPTPTKSHYTFNLRDISRVMQVRARTWATPGFAALRAPLVSMGGRMLFSSWFARCHHKGAPAHQRVALLNRKCRRRRCRLLARRGS